MDATIHLEDHGGGKATVFYGNGQWKRLPRGRHIIASWIDEDGIREIEDSEIWDFLEHAYQHQETTIPIRRYPRVKPDLKPGLPVYSAEFGFGEIVAIEGDVKVAFDEKDRLIDRNDLITRIEAEVNWHNLWLMGEKRRIEEGKRLLIVKGLCPYGEWQVFLDRYEIPRSTADDLIRRYADKILQEGGRLHLTGYRSSSANGSHAGTELISDPTNALAELVEEENEKRRGKTPTAHTEYWNVRIKLRPHIVIRCREVYKEPGAKEYWRRAAYEFVEENPGSEESTASEPDSDSDQN
jgi:hypothetical protein